MQRTPLSGKGLKRPHDTDRVEIRSMFYVSLVSPRISGKDLNILFFFFFFFFFLANEKCIFFSLPFLALKIHISPYTYEAIKHRGGYIVLDRGEIDVKVHARTRTHSRRHART